MGVKPITPEELEVSFPDECIEAWNKLIANHYNSGTAIIKIEDARKALKNIPGYQKRWLDIEKFYSEHGWSVYYDQADYTESRSSFYRFTPKRD